MTHNQASEDNEMVGEFVAYESGGETRYTLCGGRVSFTEEQKRAIESLIAERDRKRDAYIIGEDNDQRWDDEGSFCTTCDAFLEDDKFRCYCDIVNAQKAIQRKRSEEVI